MFLLMLHFVLLCELINRDIIYGDVTVNDIMHSYDIRSVPAKDAVTIGLLVMSSLAVMFTDRYQSIFCVLAWYSVAYHLPETNKPNLFHLGKLGLDWWSK